MAGLRIRQLAAAAALVCLVALDAGAQERTRAYVATGAGLTVVDALGGGLARSIDLGAPPHDVVVAEERVYVSLPTANRIAIVDPVTLTVIGSITVPGAPRDLEVVTQLQVSRLFVGTDDGLRIYDRNTGVVSGPVDVGPGRILEAAQLLTGRRLHVAGCDATSTIRTYDDASGAVSAPVAAGTAPCAVLAAGDGVYVADRTGGTITRFTEALASPQVVGALPQARALADGSTGVWATSPSGGVGTFTVVLVPRPPHAATSFQVTGLEPTAIATMPGAGGADVVLVTTASGDLHVLSSAGAVLRTIAVGAGARALEMGDRSPVDPVAAPADGSFTQSQGLEPSMSLDGRFVAFTSDAATLVPGDTNGQPDVFVRDRLLRRTARVSVTSAGGQGTGGAIGIRAGSYAPVLSGDGRYVLFLSVANNLVAGDGNDREDIFLHDRDVDADGLFDEPGQIATRRISLQSDGSEATCRVVSLTACVTPSIAATLSRDGRHVAFSSILEFDPADVNGLPDIFAIDVATGRTSRVSRRPGGVPGAGIAGTPVISANGRVVAFRTSDPGMVSYDSNGVDDVFAVDRDPDGNGVYDEQPPSFTHVSLQPGGALYPFHSAPVAISDDGRWVGYASLSTLGIYDRSTGHNALVRAAGMPIVSTGQFSPDARYLSTIGFGAASTFIRIDRDTDADGILDEAGAVDGGPIALIRWDGTAIATDATARLIPVSTLADLGGLGIRNVFEAAWPPYDSDGDGLGNGFESRFGLNPSSGLAADGAGGDPDGDGRTNAEEQLAGTHPRGLETRYLAEGATGSFFSTRIAVANPGVATRRVLLRYQTDTGQTTSSLLAIPPMSRRFVNVGSVASLGSASFSTVIEADGPIAADRTMLWTSAFYGSSAETSVPGPATTWFLAEGATHGGFDLFYLLQNPSATQTAEVEIRFLRPSGAPIVRTYTVAPARRLTVPVDTVPGLEAADVSAAISSTNAVPIIVERAMYYSTPGQPFAAGHASAGVTAAATQWFLPEGATGSFFNLFLLLANPSAQAAEVTITYLRPNGAPIVRTRTLAANSRTTINVAQEDPALADTPVSTVVESTNAVGVVAERAMWWPATGGWHEAHNSPGATGTAARWAFGDGEVGGPPFSTQTYFLIANTGTQAATVRVTLLPDAAPAVSKTFTVPANSRFNVPVATEFPAVLGGFGALIESIDSTPVPIVVERAMYSNAGGVVWAAGTDALGTPIP